MNASETNFNTINEATESRYAWEQIRETRFQIANEMDAMVSELDSGTASWIKPIAGWLRGSASYEEALAQPMVLAICLPLSRKRTERHLKTTALHANNLQNLESGTTSSKPDETLENFSASEIRQAVQWGFQQVVGRQKTVSWRIFGLLLYPLITILVAWILWVVACFFFFPQIEQAFKEFGIALPKFTMLLFWCANTVREWWGTMIFIPILYIVLFITLNYLSSNKIGNSASWLDRKLVGKRRAIANWSWHLSLLLDWGLATRTAVMVAGMTSHRGWLQQCCLDWIGETYSPMHGHSGPESNPNPDRNFLSQRRFQLVNHAIALPDGQEKILLLREISTYYQEKSSAFTEWMIAWLSTLMVWISFGMIILVVIAIYSPLMSIFRFF